MQIASFIFRPPLIDFADNPDKLISLAAAEGVVYALDSSSNGAGSQATGNDPMMAMLLNCTNLTSLPPETLAKWGIPPGEDPMAWCQSERRNVTRALAYNAAFAASSGNEQDAEMGAAFADQQYNNTHGHQASCSIP